MAIPGTTFPSPYMQNPEQPFGPQAVPGMVAPNPTQMQNAPMDYSSLVQGFVAPYQDIAQKMYQPYPALPGGAQLAQNHPGLAGVLNNAFLGAAFTAPGMTIGQNIGNVARGFVEANQFNRQRQLESMMLPYQLAEPQFRMATQLGQLQRDQAYWNYIMQGQLPYRQSQIGYNTARENQMQFGKPTGRALVGDDGGAYQEVVNNGQIRMVNALTGQPAGPNVKFPTYNQTHSQTLMGLIGDVQNGIPGAQDKLNTYIDTEGKIAQHQSTGRQAGTMTQDDITREITEARNQFKTRQPLTENAYVLGHPPGYGLQDYDKYRSDFQNQEDQRRQAYNAKVDQYEKAARIAPMTWAEYNQIVPSNGPTVSGGGAPVPPQRSAPPAQHGFAAFQKQFLNQQQPTQ